MSYPRAACFKPIKIDYAGRHRLCCYVLAGGFVLYGIGELFGLNPKFQIYDENDPRRILQLTDTEDIKAQSSLFHGVGTSFIKARRDIFNTLSLPSGIEEVLSDPKFEVQNMKSGEQENGQFSFTRSIQDTKKTTDSESVVS